MIDIMIVVLLISLFLILGFLFGLWYGYRKGYDDCDTFWKKTNRRDRRVFQSRIKQEIDDQIYERGLYDYE